MDRYRAIELLEYIKHAFHINGDACAKSIDKGIEALNLLNDIQGIVENAEDVIRMSYGTDAAEGYKDIFNVIKEKIQKQ